MSISKEPHFATARKNKLSGLFKYCRTNLVDIFKRGDPLNNQFDALKSYSAPFLYLQFQKLVHENKDDLGQVFSQLGILSDKLNSCEEIEIFIDNETVKQFHEKVKLGEETLKSLGLDTNGKFTKNNEELFGIQSIDHIKIDLEFAKYLLDGPGQRSSTLKIIEDIYKRRQERNEALIEMSMEPYEFTLPNITSSTSPSLSLKSSLPTLEVSMSKPQTPQAGDIISEPIEIPAQSKKTSKTKTIIQRLNLLSQKKVVAKDSIATCVNMSLSENLGEGTARFENWCKVGFKEKIKYMAKDAQTQLLIKYGTNGTFKPEDVVAALQEENGDCKKAIALCVKTRVNSVKNIRNSLNSRCPGKFKFTDKEIRQAMKAAGNNEREIINKLNTMFPKDSLLKSLRKQEVNDDYLAELRTLYADSKNTDATIRSIIVQFSMTSNKAKHTLNLLKNSELDGHKLKTVVYAVLSNSTEDGARRYLSVECLCCYCLFTRDEIEQSHVCGCHLCVGCYEQWLATTIREKDPSFWTCPTGNHDPSDLDHDFLAQSFTFLQITIENRFRHLNIADIFRNKVNEWGIMRESNFKWCGNPKCQNGFVYERDDPKMICPSCRKISCKNCGKLWSDAHNNRTCQQFEEYLLINDPDIANALKVLGIQCPSCKMRFEEARGGCMHFVCNKCRHEFCSGCNQPFLKAEVCDRFDDCSGRGFHAHHPRNCLYFTRDYSVAQLETLLIHNKIDFKPKDCQNVTKCQISVTDDDFKDLHCGKPVHKFNLCEGHYKEYLVAKINLNKLDPADTCTLDEMVVFYSREKKEPPPKQPNESNENYLSRLRQFVKLQIPIYCSNK